MWMQMGGSKSRRTNEKKMNSRVFCFYLSVICLINVFLSFFTSYPFPGLLSACDGGTDFLAYAWLLQQNGGAIADEVSYGDYLNQNGFCHYAVNDGLVTNPWNKQPVAQGAQIKVCARI
jgi:hypothetical protein